MRKTKRYIFVFLIICMAAVLTACSKKGNDGQNELSGNISDNGIDEQTSKRIGVLTDDAYDDDIKTHYPDASISYYNSLSDIIAALKNDKIDAFPGNEPVVGQFIQGEELLTYKPLDFAEFDLAFVFARTPKGAILCGKFDEFIKQKRESGELSALAEKWLGADEDKKDPPDISALADGKEMLTMSTSYDCAPFSYIKDGKPAGYDIELAYMFCRENGYALKIMDMEFNAIMQSVSTDKCDFGGAGITVTDERSESLYFSEPVHVSRAVMVIRKTNSIKTGFFASVKESFEKTFIREQRYKLFGRGINITMAITVLSLIFGNILGFAVYMLYLKGNKAAKVLADLFNRIIQGIPTVVLLMVLYYIVFGNIDMDGIWVAVLCFTLTFGSSVYSMLHMGIAAVSDGQAKAARALGFSDNQTFFKIILPQAAQHIMPSYCDELAAHIKNTAIVGYIAVQDLTKMGDIVRSRTYEAFFPLIAVAIIYFLLTSIIMFFINKIKFRLEFKHRTKEQILKGIKLNDNT